MCISKCLHSGVLVIIFCIALPLPRCSCSSNLLTSYLPASMQALAYYIDLLQYEPLSMTTVEPPFTASEAELNNVFNLAQTTTTSTTTRRPSSTTGSGSGNNSSGWWQPPNWWQSTTKKTTTTRRPTTTTTKRPTAQPTPAHKPAIYAPIRPLKFKIPLDKLEGYDLFNELGDNPEGFDQLTLSLIHDIQTETDHDDFTNDVESLDNFLRLYDDNYGRATIDPESAMDRWSTSSTSGKKRVPPTKPYVEFLLVYDLLKRDAKADNLSKYEGYSEEMLRQLHDLSKASAERQLYTLFKRMLDRGDIQRSDVVSRIQGIMKDLANPKSATSIALRYIPALQFIP